VLVRLQMSDTWRAALNNFLQSRYTNTRCLTFESTQTGPDPAPIWTVTASIVNGEVYGQGTSTRKSEASEEAARRALLALRGY